jgi:hypothetical protein
MILAVGREMKMSGNEILSGLMAAMQESSLRNLNYGDRDSIGLFQQRPSQGWGTYTQIMDPLYATRKYFTTLRGVKTRKGMSPTVMAQAVQRSGFPDAYAKWQKDAQEFIGTSKQVPELPFPLSTPNVPIEDRYTGPVDLIGDSQAAPGGLSDGSGDFPGAAPAVDLIGNAGVPGDTSQAPVMADSGFAALEKLFASRGPSKFEGEGETTGLRSSIISGLKTAIGTPYVWGGESPGGFDCSGLIQYFYSRAGVKGVPRTTYQMFTSGMGTAVNGVKGLTPGDWVFGSPERAANGQVQYGHVAIWLGNGMILEAPRTGLNVRIRKLSDQEMRDKVGYHLRLGGDK